MAVIEKTIDSSGQDTDVIEIKLGDIIDFLNRSRKAMVIGGIVGAIIGALYAWSLPNQYTSQLTVLPELQTKAPGNLGGLGSLAGLAGIDIGGLSGGSDAIRPELYPNVLQSTPFALWLFKQNVYELGETQPQLFVAYLKLQAEKEFLNSLFSEDNKDEPIKSVPIGEQGTIRIAKSDEPLIKLIKEKVSATFDKKTGVITVSATMPNRLVAAKIATYSLEYLTNYITTYRTEKARREVNFLIRQVRLAKSRYQAAEYDLSAYRDRNRSVFLNTAKIEEQRIQAEFLLTQDLYNSLSKQAEMAKVKVQEQTPVIKVLEPAKVPNKKTGPSRLIILLSAVGIGVILGTLLYLIVNRSNFNSLKAEEAK